jgi:thioester reductase-like protein
MSIEEQLAGLSPEEKRRKLAQLLQKKARLSRATLEDEVVLDEHIVANSSPPITDISQAAHIFLTGATGFLGGYLLHALLKQTTASVFCLVRSQDQQQGYARVRANLQHYQLWQESFADRIAIVLGDVSQPLLGVAPPAFTELAQRMDVVFHNAALTNFAYSYEQMKPVNVQGTHEALRLASQERTKLFQYISTIGVFEPLVFSPAVITEQHEPASTGLSRGYTQSKWVAERMVVMAQERGLPVTLYRPPIIGGDSHTGQPNSGDFVWNFIQACVEMEYAPILPALEMHISPVDYVANASVALAQKLVAGKVFHLTSPYPAMTWRQFCDILRGRGYTLATLPFDAWLNACKQRAKEHDDREMLLLAATIEDLQPIFERLAQPGSMAQIDCANTLHYLEDSAIRCPPPEQLFSTYAARVEA